MCRRRSGIVNFLYTFTVKNWDHSEFAILYHDLLINWALAMIFGLYLLLLFKFITICWMNHFSMLDLIFSSIFYSSPFLLVTIPAQTNWRGEWYFVGACWKCPKLMETSHIFKNFTGPVITITAKKLYLAPPTALDNSVSQAEKGYQTIS